MVAVITSRALVAISQRPGSNHELDRFHCERHAVELASPPAISASDRLLERELRQQARRAHLPPRHDPAPAPPGPFHDQHEFPLAPHRIGASQAAASASVQACSDSNSLVSSRASTMRRSPPSTAQQIGDALLHAVRRFVEHQRERQLRAARRARGGAPRRSPAESRRTGSAGDVKPATESAATAALGPGTGDTGKPAARAAATSCAPGSEIAGRAGVARQRHRPALAQQREDLPSAARFSLCSWTGDQPFRDPVVGQQPPGDARVLRRHGLHAAQRFQRAQADVARGFQ